MPALGAVLTLAIAAPVAANGGAVVCHVPAANDVQDQGDTYRAYGHQEVVGPKALAKHLENHEFDAQRCGGCGYAGPADHETYLGLKEIGLKIEWPIDCYTITPK